MASKIKKAFTLVELLVVIAIIAILGTVSIVGYFSFTNKANKSNDSSFISQLNVFVKGALVDTDSGDFNYVEEVNKSLTQYEFSDKGFKITSKNMRIGFDIDKDELVLIDETKAKGDLNVFAFVNSTEDAKNMMNKGYSLYLQGSALDYPDFDKLDINVGLDCGKVILNEINFKNTSEPKDVVIYTNGGTLNIDDTQEKSHQLHFGRSEYVTVATGTSCYVSHAIIDEMLVKEGTLIADSDAVIAIVHALPTAQTPITLTEQNGGVFVIPEYVESEEISTSIAQDLGYKEEDEYYVIDDGSSKGQEKETKTSYVISSVEDLVSYRDEFNKGNTFTGFKVILNNDIDLSKTEWAPIGNWEFPFNGTFDGQGHTIKGLFVSGKAFNEEGVYSVGNCTGYGEVFGFFGIVGNGDSLIKNVNFTDVNIDNKYAQNVGTVIGYAPFSEDFSDTNGKGGFYAPGKWTGNTTVGNNNIKLENVNVSGYLNVKAHVGGFFGKNYNIGKTTFKNCNNATSIKSYGTGGIGGFVGYVDKETTTEFNNCKNLNGSKINITSNDSVYIIGEYGALESQATEVINNCSSELVFENLSNNSFRSVNLTNYTNLNIKDSSFGAFCVYGNTTLENCKFNHYFEGNVEKGKIVNRGIAVLKDCEVNVSITNYGVMTINGGTLSDKNVNDGTITIKDGMFSDSFTNHGKMRIDGGTFNELIYNHDELEINAGSFSKKITNNENGTIIINAGTYSTIANDGEITINGGLFKGKITNGSSGKQGSVLTINGGTFDSYVSNYDVLTIKNATCNERITNYETGNVVINSGTYSTIKNDGEATINSGIFNGVITNGGTSNLSAKLVINDGSFRYVNKGSSGASIKNYGYLTINGGSYDGEATSVKKTIYDYYGDGSNSNKCAYKTGEFKGMNP